MGSSWTRLGSARYAPEELLRKSWEPSPQHGTHCMPRSSSRTSHRSGLSRALGRLEPSRSAPERMSIPLTLGASDAVRVRSREPVGSSGLDSRRSSSSHRWRPNTTRRSGSRSRPSKRPAREGAWRQHPIVRLALGEATRHRASRNSGTRRPGPVPPRRASEAYLSLHSLLARASPRFVRVLAPSGPPAIASSRRAAWMDTTQRAQARSQIDVSASDRHSTRRARSETCTRVEPLGRR